MILALASLACVDAAAAPLATVAGVELASGPPDRTTRTAYAGFGLGLASMAAASLVVARSEDAWTGSSTALAAGAVVAAGPAARLRGRVTRSIGGEHAFRFTRLALGPEFGRMDGPRATLLYERERTDGGLRSDGASADLAAPLGAGWSARAEGSWHALPESPSAITALAGLGWAPVRGLELVGEAGVARGTTPSGAVGPRGLLDPILGGPPPEAPAERTRARLATRVGVQLVLP